MIGGRYFDVVIVGGGLAGSTAAALLGVGKCSVALIDTRTEVNREFTCEALTEGQVARFRSAGLLDAILPTLTPSGGLWIAHQGRVIEHRASHLYGFDYSEAVRQLRGRSPVTFIEGNVVGIRNSPVQQVVSLASGDAVTCRLVVLATGGNQRLRRSLGISQAVTSAAHSISIGFDLRQSARGYAFPALTVYPRSVRDRFSYLTLFRLGARLRANLFVYREPRDPWHKAFMREPEAALTRLVPELESLIGDFEITSPVQLRPVDLYEVQDPVRPGVVLIGDAFANSCPAAGTGIDKIVVDAERLSNRHAPRWLASAGMGVEKVAGYYADPEKRATDAWSSAHAGYVKAITIDPSMKWHALRLRRSLGGRIREKLRASA